MCALADLADSCSLLTRLVQQILLAPPRLPSKLASHVVEELKIGVVIEVVQKDFMYSLCSTTGDIISDSQTGEFKWMVSESWRHWAAGKMAAWDTMWNRRVCGRGWREGRLP